MRRLTAAPLVLLLVVLAGCSAIERGTITAKVIEPANTTYIQQCTGYDSKGVCRSWMPVPIHDDEDYRFDLRLEDETGYIYVDRTTFDSYNEGDFYDG